MRIGRIACGVAALGMLAVAAPVHAALLPLSNGSFESPTTVFATPGATDWLTDGPVHDPQFGFNPYTGVFVNTDAAAPDHISNLDQSQAAYIGTQTGNFFSQSLTTAGPGNTTIPVTVQGGQHYTLSVGVARSLTSPPAETDLLRIALFWIDDAQQQHNFASTDIPNSTANALSPNLLKYFTAESDLAAGDPAVGHQIGVLLTTVGDVGGFFDMDNVTLSAVAIPEPASIGFLAAGGLLALRRRRRAV